MPSLKINNNNVVRVVSNLILTEHPSSKSSYPYQFSDSDDRYRRSQDTSAPIRGSRT
jgi:hypothetical protein